MATASRITPTEALLDSWTRQCKIIDNIVGILTPELLEAKPSEDGWTIAFHLAHMHGVRRFWHKNASGAEAPVGASLYTATGETWADFIPNTDLKEIRERLKESETLVLDWTAGAIESGQQQSGNYDHPIYYLQHMIWHEGWHVGLIMLALRRAGAEQPEEWEDKNVWDLWRLPG